MRFGLIISERASQRCLVLHYPISDRDQEFPPHCCRAATAKREKLELDQAIVNKFIVSRAGASFFALVVCVIDYFFESARHVRRRALSLADAAFRHYGQGSRRAHPTRFHFSFRRRDVYDKPWFYTSIQSRSACGHTKVRQLYRRRRLQSRILQVRIWIHLGRRGRGSRPFRSLCQLLRDNSKVIQSTQLGRVVDRASYRFWWLRTVRHSQDCWSSDDRFEFCDRFDRARTWKGASLGRKRPDPYLLRSRDNNFYG